MVILERRANPKIFSSPNKEILRSMPKEAKTASKFKTGYQGIFAGGGEQQLWRCSVLPSEGAAGPSRSKHSVRLQCSLLNILLI